MSRHCGRTQAARPAWDADPNSSDPPAEISDAVNFDKDTINFNRRKGSLTLKGKICLVTGANSGIGKFTAIGLANLGATVVMVCRDDERGRAAREEIVSSTGNESIDLLIADLSLSRSIRQLADDFLSKYERLDVLVNNAGAYAGSRTLTGGGL